MPICLFTTLPFPNSHFGINHISVIVGRHDFPTIGGLLKRIAIILVITLLMTVSFAAIGGLILYATGTVTSVDDLESMVSGSGTQAYVENDVGGTTLLEQQKSELATELGRTKRMIEGMRTLTDIIASSANGDEASRLAALERAGAWLEKTDTRTSADILKSLDEDLVVALLARTDKNRITEILGAMDKSTRTRLIGAMAKE